MSTATRQLKIEPATVNIPSQIRLKGAWLGRAGFQPGEHVTVTVEAGRLTIEVLSQNHDTARHTGETTQGPNV